MQRLYMPRVEYEGVLPVVVAHQLGGRRHCGREPPGAVPARLPDGARPRVLQEHGGLRQTSGPARGRHQFATGITV